MSKQTQTRDDSGKFISQEVPGILVTESTTPAKTLIGAAGGRKFLLILVALILVAFQEKLGIKEELVQYIIWLALGGSGAIALEDGVKKLSEKR